MVRALVIGIFAELAAEAKAEFDRTAHWTPAEYAGQPVSFSSLQTQASAWQCRNFGVVPQEWSALGVIEEIGELCQSLEGPSNSPIDDAHQRDAIGDIVIYLCGVCTAARLDLGVIAEVTLPDSGRGSASVIQGVLAHVVLKRAQKIRTMRDDTAWREAITRSVYDVMGFVRYWSRMQKLGDVLAIVNGIATRVFARDWRKDPNKGGET